MDTASDVVSSSHKYQIGDIIQIVNEKSTFHRCLFVVHTMSENGCWAYMTTQDENHWSPFDSRDFTVVGKVLPELLIRKDQDEGDE